MPRALLFFNAHRGQCQKRRRLKEAEGDYEKVVGRSPVQRSLCREVVEVVMKRREKTRKQVWANAIPGGSCRGQVREAPGRAARLFSGSAASLIHVAADRGVGRAAAG